MAYLRPYATKLRRRIHLLCSDEPAVLADCALDLLRSWSIFTEKHELRLARGDASVSLRRSDSNILTCIEQCSI